MLNRALLALMATLLLTARNADATSVDDGSTTSATTVSATRRRLQTATQTPSPTPVTLVPVTAAVPSPAPAATTTESPVAGTTDTATTAPQQAVPEWTWTPTTTWYPTGTFYVSQSNSRATSNGGAYYGAFWVLNNAITHLLAHFLRVVISRP